MSSFPIRPRHTKGPSLYRNLRDNMVLQTSWNARYLPHSALKHVFPESVIASTLEKHQATFRIDISQLVSFISNRALKLFATLVWSGLEFLIEEFYDHNFDDDRLPVQLRYDENEGAVDVEAFTFKSNGLHAIENHPFGGESWTMRSLDQFSETDQWLFVSPVFHDRQFRYTLHDLCRMPFIEDENAIVREAYFSVLEQRRIHRDHLQISDLEHIHLGDGGHPYVAIKEIKRMHLSDAQFKEISDFEADSLARLREMNHPHLIKALAYYTRGSRRFIMYPWAQGNLQDFWQSDPPPLNQSYLSWVFAQLCGLSDGIDRLHNYGSGGYSFRHGDIKPENILYFSRSTASTDIKRNSEGMFVIADTGLAQKHVQLTELRKTATRTQAGTAMYEPPDTELRPTSARSRRFDIWSIGCIFLEFATWLLYGTTGLNRFREKLYRLGSPRFYTIVQNRNTSRKSARLNEVVRSQLDLLRHDSRCSNATALRRLVDLIEARLLVVDLIPVSELTHDSDEYEGTVISESIASTPATETSTSTSYFGHSDSSSTCRAHSNEMVFLMRKIRDDASSKLLPKIDWINWNVPGTFSYVSDHHNPKSERPIMNRTIKGYQTEYLNPPFNDDWEYNHDFEMARYIFSDSQLRATSKLTKQLSELCQQCSQRRLWHPMYYFSVEKATLTNSAETCDLCQLIFHCVQKHTSDVPTQFYCYRMGSFIAYEDQKGAPIISMYTVPTAKALGNEPTASDIQIGFPTLPQVDNPLHTKVIRGWLRSCNDTHQCYTPNTEFFPTRVVYVGPVGSPTVRLICDTKSIPEKEPYLALSHQWGPAEEHRRFCTYARDVENCPVEKIIRVHHLPRTFRDAVFVTRNLGIPYLWIDSLCIIQDSSDDWDAESQLMEQVYSSAYATIAASCARGTNDGFLKPRVERQSVTLTKDDGSTYYLCDVIDNFQADVEQGELSKRAWVLQERALSRRTIYFTEKQTYWECGGGVRCETLTRMNNRKASFLGDPNFPNAVERYVKARKIEICQGLYERYSNLTLSFEADRPIAIRGLEARLVSTLNTVGGYGMFERFLHRCLLWRRSGDTLKRIQLFRGETVPSWSWMAYTGGICYMNVPFGDVSWNKEIVSPFSNNSSEDSALKMPVIKAQAWDLVDTEKHILVLDEPGRFIDDPLKQNKYVEVFDKEGDEVGELKCVIVGTSKGSTPVRDIQSTSDQEHTYYVLIIAPAGGSQSNLYERVGIAELEGQHVALSKASIDVCIQ